MGRRHLMVVSEVLMHARGFLGWIGRSQALGIDKARELIFEVILV